MFDVNFDKHTKNIDLIDDLGLDSFQFVELLVEIESQLGVYIDDELDTEIDIVTKLFPDRPFHFKL